LSTDYGIEEALFLPPCVDPDRYRVHSPEECDHLWSFLATHTGRPAAELQGRRLIVEISRTDTTKRKDVLIEAFARVREEIPEAFLAVAIDDRAPLHEELTGLIRRRDLTDHVVVLGSVWVHLPCLYAVADVYCTPSVMEGFGMSAQEAAACGTPVVASNLVPFAVEYLLGPGPTPTGTDPALLVGEGAVVVPADDVPGFASALILLLSDDGLRARMGRAARDITVPYFTWRERTRDLLDRLGLEPGPDQPRG